MSAAVVESKEGTSLHKKVSKGHGHQSQENGLNEVKSGASYKKDGKQSQYQDLCPECSTLVSALKERCTLRVQHTNCPCAERLEVTEKVVQEVALSASIMSVQESVSGSAKSLSRSRPPPVR
jgi:hypothetical protein|mmetsp:Transcript_73774/g.123292  ORF Transcript_73774/g.123292 Transcript_73774/m.123292 type:complete len:122 (+) Transcript_73774:536-901(+)